MKITEQDRSSDDHILQQHREQPNVDDRQAHPTFRDIIPARPKRQRAWIPWAILVAAFIVLWRVICAYQ